MTEGDRMSTEDPGSTTLPKLLSVPGLVAVGIFGVAVIVVSRIFGPENILREVATEVLASFGSTILLRGAPGGEALAESADRLRGLVQDLDQQARGAGDPRDRETLDRIEESVRSLADEIRGLRNETRELPAVAPTSTKKTTENPTVKTAPMGLSQKDICS